MTDQLTALEALEAAVEAGGFRIEPSIVAFGGQQTNNASRSFHGDMSAAIALAESVVPEWGWFIDSTGRAELFNPNNIRTVKSHNVFPTRALLLTVIRAKIVEVKEW